MLPESKLTKSQKKTYSKVVNSKTYHLVIRHDDECGNGHNTFAMTYHRWNRQRTDWEEGGHDPEKIARIWPEFAHHLKWHLCSTNGPLHYIANSMYHASDKGYKEPDLEAARSCAIWLEAALGDFIEEKLLARLPALMQEFKAAIEALGFEY